MRPHAHRFRLGLLLPLLLVVAILDSVHTPLRLAMGDSLPKGFYWLQAGPYSRDSIVLACLPDPVASLGRARGYLHRGSCDNGTRPVGKPIAAISGDFISLGPDEIRVNGVRIAGWTPSDRDSLGLPLVRVPDGVYEVASDEVWLISTHHPRSWDSRYFGPVSVDDLVGRLQPIWVVSEETGAGAEP